LTLENLVNFLPALFDGLIVTLTLTLVSAFLGVILGLFLALGRLTKNKITEKACWLYIWVFRGTPLLMQIVFFYYALPLLDNRLSLPKWPAAFLALSLNAAAYFAEIFRGGILSIDKGQFEAATALGLSYAQTMRKIIIPQAYRRLIPPMSNEFIALSKDTSLVSAIGMTDLLYATTQISNNNMLPIIFIPSAILYLVLTTLFTFVFEKIEKKYSAYE